MSTNGNDLKPVNKPYLPLQRLKRYSLRFSLPYYTQWGQNLVLVGSDPLLGSWEVSKALSMRPSHHGKELFWSVEISVPSDFQAEYKYCVVDDSRNVLRREAGLPRSLCLPSGFGEGSLVDIRDLWQDASSPENFLSRSAFKGTIFQQDALDAELDVHQLQQSFTHEDLEDSLVVRFRIQCPRVQNGQSVYLTGSATSLGKWSDEKALKLSNFQGRDWVVDCVVKIIELPLRYKYVLKTSTNEVVPEIGGERKISLEDDVVRQPLMIINSDGYFRDVPWRGAGIAVPVFSLRSNDDVGAGEFLDIKLLVDMAVKSGLHLIQLLPVNDTSVNGMWWDSYPYSSLSVFALHPLYLRLQRLSENIPQHIQEDIEEAKRKLDLEAVDYDATMAAKISIAKKIFYLEKDTLFNTNKFKQYFSENKHWLKPYAAFCFLRDFFGMSDHSQWGIYSTFAEEKLEKLVSPSSEHYNTILFNYFIQYHLHTQLTEAAEYARKNRVVLKGDLPIGVDRNSVDTWVYPTLFRMNTSTGAPPDYFDKNGQNWGFPTYNWEEMSKDNYGWWRARLSQLAKYFTAYRIDHVLGFFRIWELPDHAATGLMGKFRPSIPLSQEELEQAGLWDFNKLSKPYIRCHILQEKFAEKWKEISSRFMDEYEPLCYEFKEEYNTEKKIVKHLEKNNLPADEFKALKSKLIDLIQEVALMRDPEDPRKFYPRFNLHMTALYNELDDASKHTLMRFYHDYYFQRQEGLWKDNAMKTLPVLLNSSNMLCCGEDLGLIPACVHPVLQELGLIGLRIQRMPSKPGVEFATPSEYEYSTVCAPSCHDSSTLRAWWEEDQGRRTRFYRDVLNFAGGVPDQCEPPIVYAVLEQHMESPSMWSIIPLQDFLALRKVYAERPAKEETINDPTNPRHYWRYRVHVNLETILGDDELVALIRELVESGGRSTPVSPQPSSETSIPTAYANGNSYVVYTNGNDHTGDKFSKPGLIKFVNANLNGEHHVHSELGNGN